MRDDRENSAARRFSDELRERLREDRPYTLEDLMGRDRPATEEDGDKLERGGDS